MPKRDAASAAVVEISKTLNAWGSDDDTISGILHFLDTLSRGRPLIARNPSTSSIPIDDLRAFYMSIVDLEYPWLQPFSHQEMDKFQPRSNIPPFDSYRDKLVSAWHSTPTWNVNDTYRVRARQIVNSLITSPSESKLRPTSISSAIDSLERDTNSGSYKFTRRSTVIDSFRPELVELVQGLHEGTEVRGKYILTTRAKEGKLSEGTDTGARVVQMSSIDETALGLQIQIPMLTRMKRVNLFPSMSGPLFDDMSMIRILRGGHTLSGDIKAFDFSVNENKIHEFEAMLCDSFTKDSWPIISRAIECCTQGQLITPNGVLPPVGHFVKSGWAMTNMADSYINAVDIVYNMLMIGHSFNVDDPPFVVNGDDFILNIEPAALDEFIGVSGTHGMVLEPSKQVSSRELCYFNARFMHTELMDVGASVRSSARAARSLEFPETISALTEGGQSLRLVAILNTLWTNPVSKDVIQFHIQHDRLGLGTKSRTAWESVFGRKTIQVVGKALGLDRVSVPQAVSLKGISEWPITQYLFSLLEA